MRNGRSPHAGCYHTSASREETAVLHTLPRPCSRLQTVPGTGDVLPAACPVPDPAVFREAVARWRALRAGGVPAAAVRLPHGTGGRAVRAGRRGLVRGSRGDVAGAAVPGAGV